jgi:hypothetical protein
MRIAGFCKSRRYFPSQIPNQFGLLHAYKIQINEKIIEIDNRVESISHP